MRVEASLSRHDLVDLFAELLPLTIRVGGTDQFIAFHDPEPVALVAGEGLRLVCKARISWPVLGISVPVTVNRVVVRVRPEVSNPGTLAFRFALEHVDFAFLPDVVDRSLTEKINAELAQRPVGLAWDFATSLARTVSLPGTIEPRRAIHLEVAAGDVRVTDQCLTLTVAFRGHVKTVATPG